MHQPPLKKVAADGPIGVMPLNSLPINMQGIQSGYSNVTANSTTSLPSSAPQQLANARIPGSANVREIEGRPGKLSGVFNQAWKDETDTGDLLLAMYNHFGESILPFSPNPEMFLFI